MGIASSILATALEAAEKEGASRINEIRITVGDLAEIMDDALQFSFEVIRQDTIAADGELVINRLPAISVCAECGERFEHDKYDFVCPKCGGFVSELVQGRELRIDSIDID